MRLIDADKADVERISCFYGSECCLADVQEWMDEQPTFNPWNDAKSNPPDGFVDVLCWYEYFRYGDYNCMYQTYGIGYYDDVHKVWCGEVSNGHKARVVAWAPLFDPPKE